MIKFDPYKKKTISFKVAVEGITQDLLEYKLRLSDGKMEYGFKGNVVNDKVTFTIPPLSEVVMDDKLSNIKEVKLEVNDKEGKYYLKPYMSEAQVVTAPKVNTEMIEESDGVEESIFSVETSLVEEETEEKETKIEPVTKKSKSKISEFLKG